MIKFSKEKVLLLHKLIAEETGGSIGLRDESRIFSVRLLTFSSEYAKIPSVCSEGELFRETTAGQETD